MTRDVDAFYAAAPDATRPLARKVRAFAKKHAPGLREEMKWAAPSLVGNRPVLYVAAYAAHVSLGFYSGATLADPDGLLEGTGKGMRHAKIRQAKDLSPKLARLVKAAVAQDRAAPARPPARAAGTARGARGGARRS